ncbi:MAG TPA: methyltransferase domain-containing protein [Verrucomicrobiae bacterium]|nr:methyltransferase domain-containing protein [Verrucomicrobiae bacterium]
MHPDIFQAFENLCRPLGLRGSVLEVGATPDASSLLNLPALAAVHEKIGLNLSRAGRFKDYSIIEGNANAMTCFPDNRFDAVLCNATLEHDPFFWKSIAEIRRVTKSGGAILIGTPGYGVIPFEKKVRRLLGWLPRPLRPALGGLNVSTLTLQVHNFPGDYYRFSEQTYRDVFFEGLQAVAIQSVMSPPRIIGFGRKP